jgi:hypothetical protein
MGDGLVCPPFRKSQRTLASHRAPALVRALYRRLLLPWPQFHDFRHVLLPRGVSKRLEYPPLVATSPAVAAWLWQDRRQEAIASAAKC